MTGLVDAFSSLEFWLGVFATLAFTKQVREGVGRKVKNLISKDNTAPEKRESKKE